MSSIVRNAKQFPGRLSPEAILLLYREPDLDDAMRIKLFEETLGLLQHQAMSWGAERRWLRAFLEMRLDAGGKLEAALKRLPDDHPTRWLFDNPLDFPTGKREADLTTSDGKKLGDAEPIAKALLDELETEEGKKLVTANPALEAKAETLKKLWRGEAVEPSCLTQVRELGP